VVDRLAGRTWPEMPARALVLVPVGSVEQHGPHLPLHTDSVIAEAVAGLVAQGMAAGETPVLVAPTLTYGASGEHQSFTGTSSIGTDALTQTLVELVRSMRTWAERVVFINGHGGNVQALRKATAQTLAEGHDVAWVPCRIDGADAHAGHTETSLMLHLCPSGVRWEHAAAGNSTPIADLLPDLMRGGVRSASPNGVLGDPSGASAEQGADYLETMVRNVLMALGWPTDSRDVVRRQPSDRVL